MFIQILFFTSLILIRNHFSYDYFIRYTSHDIPCSILSNESLWIRCLINQTNPLKFLSKTSFTNLHIDFIIKSIDNLTIPSNFFLDENNNKYVDYSFITFDSTENSHFKQINLLTEVFSNKIYFIIQNCGYPILHIERINLIKHLLVTYNNRSRTVLLYDYFANECLNNVEIRENDLIQFDRFHRKKFVNLTKLFINGILFSLVIILTSILMCLITRKDGLLKNLNLSYNVIQSGRTSTVLSPSTVVSRAL